MENNQPPSEEQIYFTGTSKRNLFSRLKEKLNQLSLLTIISFTLIATAGSSIWLSQTELLTRNFSPPDEIEVLTAQLLKAKQERKIKTGPEIKKTIEIAQKRQELLLEKAKTEPKVFVEKAKLAPSREEFPEEAKPFIEREVKLTGQLTVAHGDDFETGKSFNLYTLKAGETGKDYYILYFPVEPTDLTTQTTVEVNGVSLDQDLVVREIKKLQVQRIETQQVLPAQISNAKVAVILARFSNTTLPALPKSDIESEMFTAQGSVKKFFEETSFGKMSVNGQVFGWYTIPASVSNDSPCLSDFWIDLAKQQAAANGVNLSDFNVTFYLFDGTKPTGCPGGGADSLLSRVWIFYRAGIDKIGHKGIQAHELGHILGLGHANALDCGSKQIDSSCKHIEYGDVTDVMGFVAESLIPFNGPHKLKLGWANVQNVTTTGTYTIAPLDKETTNPQVVQIPKSDTDEYYFISYRQKLGFGNNIPGTNTEGVSIHKAGPGFSPSWLLDTTPNTNTGGFDYFDAALSDGGTFTDGINNITIKQLSHTLSTSTAPGNATVEINISSTLPTSFQRIFTTSTTYNGNLGGLTGADAKCQERANAANLGGGWKAWLSDSQTSAASRLNHSSNPYKRIDGKTVASNWDDLITKKSDGNYLRNPINIDEYGKIHASTDVSEVWTNTKTDGGIEHPTSIFSCNNWSDSNYDRFGAIGHTHGTASWWTSSGSASGCNSSYRLFCFEEPAPSATPTSTPIPTLTPSPSPSSTASPTPTPSPTPSPTPTPTPTPSPSPSPTVSPTPSPTSSPSLTPSPAPQAIGYSLGETREELEQTQEPSNRVDGFPVTIDYTFKNPEPGNKILYAKFFYSDNSSTIVFSTLIYRPSTPSPNPSSTPTASPSPSPTPSPTLLPTLSPTPSPSPEPTPSPTPEPTPTPAITPSPSPNPLPGDANGDNVVDIVDYSILQSEFGKKEPPELRADFNEDGQVDIVDYSILVKYFGQGN